MGNTLAKQSREELERVSVQFTSEQVEWIDRQAVQSQSFSRAAAVRLIVQEAMDHERQQEPVAA